MARQHGLWLSWHDHVRSRSLSAVLQLPFRVYSRPSGGALRHVEGSLWTIWMLARHRPRVIFLQKSFMLLLLCALYRQIRGSRVCIINDCHNKSLRRDVSGALGIVFRWLKRWSFRRVDLVLVSNPQLIAEAASLCPEVRPCAIRCLMWPTCVRRILGGHTSCSSVALRATSLSIWSLPRRLPSLGSRGFAASSPVMPRGSY